MKVFIGCSSNVTIDEKYTKLAYDIASAIAKKDHSLVYGGASYSMMGECYKAFADNNKDIIAIMPEKYKEDLVNLKLSNNFVVKTSLERMAQIYEEADAFLIIPGGLGTLGELLNILEENRTNVWKKIIIYNFEGFFDFIINWLNMNVNSGFFYEKEYT